MDLTYVTNLSPGLTSGGFSGMNVSMLGALGAVARVRTVGPVDPPVLARERIAYRARRAIGALRVPGVRPPFVAFSEARLARIAATVHASLGAVPVVFHGFTPWIGTRPAVPYAAWSDCTFRDYAAIYHPPGRFDAHDLRRIEQAEATWLRGAAGVWFTSAWAAKRATKDYRLDPTRVRVVGFHGMTEPPSADTYAGGSEFAFVSTDFAAKGGHVVVEAFQRVRAHWPEARLVIVGDAPPVAVAAQPGVRYAGFLRKEIPAEAAAFRDVLALARAVVLPTRADISPLLLVEAGGFGCPAIASRCFAIPEIVLDGEGGLLLENPSDVSEVAAAMTALLHESERYDALRRGARAYACERYSRATFCKCVADALAMTFSGTH